MSRRAHRGGELVAKRCLECGDLKTPAEFSVNRDTPDGFDRCCRPCASSRRKQWKLRNPEQYKRLDLRNKIKHKEKRLVRTRRYYSEHREDLKRKELERGRKFKDMAYELCGGYICACCRETQPAFLGLDHVLNDGNKHRKEIGVGVQLYRWIVNNPDKAGTYIQVLCFNCNQGKRLNGGTCPHVMLACFGLEVEIL